MKRIVLLAALTTAFFSSHAYATQRFGFYYAEIRGSDGKTEGCGRGSDGRTYCVKQSWCVPFTNICSWEFADSEDKKARKLATKTQDDGSFKVVDVDGKKPDSAEKMVIDDVNVSGISKAEWEKLEKEENDFARMVREIQVKRAEQEKKRKLEEQGLGGGSQGGGSQGGGSQGGGSQGGGSQGGGSQGGGSQGGGSQGGGSQGGGSQGGGSSGGGSSGGGSSGGGSSGNKQKGRVYYYEEWVSFEPPRIGRIFGDSPQSACSGSIGGTNYFWQDGVCYRGTKDNKYVASYGSFDADEEPDSCKTTINVTQNGGGFSLICNGAGENPKGSGSPFVGSLGGDDGGDKGTQSDGASSQSGGGGGGSKPKTGGSFQTGGSNSAGGSGSADGSGGAGKGNGSGNSKGSGDGYGQGNGVGDDVGDDKDKPSESEEDLSGIEKLILGVIDSIEKMNEAVTKRIDAITEKLDALASALGDGINPSGDDGGKDGDDKDRDGKDGDGKDGGKEGDGQGNAKGDGVDWGVLDKDSEIGDFSKAQTFAESGSCPADIPIDFGQFGTVSFQMKPLCDSAEKLRPVIVMFAWFISAFMVYRTINSTL